MEEFRIKRNTRSPKIFLGIIIAGVLIGSGISLFLYLPMGILGILGAALLYIFVYRKTAGKVELVMDDKGLRYYFKGDLDRSIGWEEVQKVEVFDQAHHDFIFKIYVKEGRHFMPDPYDFRADDMREAYKRLKEFTRGLDITFLTHDEIKFA